MICIIDLKKYIPHASSRFTQLECESFMTLHLELCNIIELIKSYDNEAFFSISIEIQQADEQQVPSRLLKFLKEQDQILFHISISSKALQKDFDEAYIASQKKWYSAQIMKQKHKVSLSLEQFSNLEKEVSLAYLHTENSDFNELIKWYPQIPQKTLLAHPIGAKNVSNIGLAVFLETIQNTSGSNHHFKLVIEIFKSILDDLYLLLGEEGLYYRLNQLTIFEGPQLKRLQEILFNPSQEKNLQVLAHPNFEYYLEIIRQWPKNLFYNWLSWYEAKTSEISLVDSIKLTQKFWLTIRDEQVKVPLLDSVDHVDFQELLENMTRLQDSISPIWKPIQLNFLFHLPWSQAERIFNLKEQDFPWISPEILNTDDALYESYVTLAKHLKHHEGRFEEIQENLKIYKLNSLKLKYLCFLYCLKPMMPKEQIQRMMDSIGNDTQLIELLLAIPKKNLFSSKILTTMLQSQEFKALLNLHALLMSKNTESITHSWTQFMEFYAQIPNPKSLNLSDTTDHSFAQIYLNSILQVISGTDDRLGSILEKFSSFPHDFQKKFIRIFLSYQTHESNLDYQAILSLMEDPQLLNDSKPCFERYFSIQSFSFFEQANQFSTVMAELKNLVNGVAYILNCYSNEDIKILEKGPLKLSFKACLDNQLLDQLKKIETQVKILEKSIQSLEDQQNEENFNDLLSQFNELERCLQDFLNTPLEGYLSPILTRKFPITGSLISNLDCSLQNPGQTFKNLFQSMQEKFDYLKTFRLDTYFKKDILYLLANLKSNEKALESLMNSNLIQTIAARIPRSLPTQKHQDLLKFLGTIQLDLQAIEQFFQRIKAIEYVNQKWPQIESDLKARHVDSETIWNICAKHQLIDGHPYASSHWKICFDLIENSIETSNLIERLDQTLQFKTKFPTKLNFDGELEHPNWKSAIAQLTRDLKSTHAESPYFHLMLEHAIDHYLKHNSPFEYQQFSMIFQKIQMDARLKIIDLTNLHDTSLKAPIAKLLENIQHSLYHQGKPWIQFIEKILLDPKLQVHLNNLESIFVWLKAESHFPWVEMIVDDHDCQLDDILELCKTFERMPNAWKIAYLAPRVEASNTSTSSNPEKISSKQAHRFPILSGYVNFISSILDFMRGEVFNDIDLETVIESSHPDMHSQLHSTALYGWNLWRRPFRPRVSHVNQLLSQEPNDCAQLALEKLDHCLLGDNLIKPACYSTKELKTIIKRLESHTSAWGAEKKELLFQRLSDVLISFDLLQSKTITDLLKQFEEVKIKLTQGVKHSEEQIKAENQLIAILICLYYKNLGKQTYPTQIISLIMALEFGNKNLIFEIDTGEGKSIINAFLAILKMVRKENNTVIVRTSNEELVFQDLRQKKHHQFFELLGFHNHELLKSSDLEQFREGGIYYTTNLQLQILTICSPQLQNTHFDLIADEVDEILDQRFSLSLAKPHTQLKGADWLYEDMNEFIDEHLKDTYTVEEWVNKAKNFILKKHQDNPISLQKFRLLDLNEKTWKKLIRGGFLSRQYISLNSLHYIVKAQVNTSGTLYQIVPCINGKPLHDFQIGLDGMVQCLAKRLQKEKDSPIQIPPYAEAVTFLNPFNYKNVSSLIGVSGSNGKVIELNQLTQAFDAESFRVDRFKSRNLQHLPNILANHFNSQISAIVDIIEKNAQPIMIFASDVRCAHEFYASIKSHVSSNKTIMLLTGEESDEDRENWLYNHKAQKFAGREHCITIVIPHFVRGTDIIPQHQEGLLTIETDIEPNERTATQKSGRPARGPVKGQTICVYNREKITSKAANFKISDINLQSIETLKSLIQKQFIITSTQEREIEQLRLWCWTHLSSFLEKTLTQTDSELLKHHLLEIFQTQWKKIKKHQPQNKSFYVQLIQELWKHMTLWMNILDFKHQAPLISAAAIDALMTISDSQEIINPDLQTRSFFVNMEKSGSFIPQAPKNSELFHDIDFSHLSRFKAPDKPQAYFLWGNFPAQQISNYLHESWKFFQINPSSENFKYFYETLLAAKELYKKQKNDSFFRMDYWFPSLNLILPWLDLEQKITNQLKITDILAQAKTNNHNIQRAIDYLESLYQSFIQPSENQNLFFAIYDFILDIIKKIMMWFYPEVQEYESRIKNKMMNFREQPTVHHLEAIHKDFDDFLNFYQQIENSPWYFLPKYFLKLQLSYLKTYIEDYFDEFAKAIYALKQFSSCVNDCSVNASLRLRCLGHFLSQENSIYRQSSYLGMLQIDDRVLSNLEREYNETQNEHHIDIKLYEFGRFFKKQLQQKWMSDYKKSVNLEEPKTEAMTEHNHYTELAKKIIAQYIQTQDLDTGTIHSSIRFKALEKEFLAAENNRQFLPILRTSCKV